MLNFLFGKKTTEQNCEGILYNSNFEATDNLLQKIEYLKIIEKDESERAKTIDSKTANLIGQTGIIFSIVSLFITNYTSSFSKWNVFIQVILILLFISILFLYLKTILIATRYLKINEYKYSGRDHNTVTKKFNSEDEFKVEEIKDMLYCIERNICVTNKKGGNLLKAYLYFQIATLMVGILSLIIIYSNLFSSTTTEKNSFFIENEIKVKGIDQITNSIDKIQVEVKKLDTINVKLNKLK